MVYPDSSRFLAAGRSRDPQMGKPVRYGRVVLADSHPTMLEGIRRLLESEVEAILIVADEMSLMQAIGRVIPDLVVADLSFQVSGDTKVARLLEKRDPEIKLIIFSVHDEATVVKEVMEAGADGFILKRRAAVDLIPAIREIRQGRRYVSPDIDIASGQRGARHERND
jgi:DNA-binding NarL/FixJ family response regulator